MNSGAWRLLCRSLAAVPLWHLFLPWRCVLHHPVFLTSTSDRQHPVEFMNNAFPQVFRLSFLRSRLVTLLYLAFFRERPRLWPTRRYKAQRWLDVSPTSETLGWHPASAGPVSLNSLVCTGINNSVALRAFVGGTVCHKSEETHLLPHARHVQTISENIISVLYITLLVVVEGGGGVEL